VDQIADKMPPGYGFSESLRWLLDEFPQLPGTAKTPAFQEPLAALRLGLLRNVQLQSLLARSCYLSAVGGWASGLPPNSGDPEFDARASNDETIIRQCHERLTSLMDRFRAMSDPDEPNQEMIAIGARIIEVQCGYEITMKHEIPFVKMGLTSLFDSMILLTYATFEVFVGDLWAAYINIHPDRFPRGDKQVKISDLEHFNFDVGHAVGDLFKYAHRANFQSFGGIKQAYGWIFDRRSPEIAAFASEPDIELTSHVRNLIAHRGSRVDRQYIKNVKPWLNHSELKPLAKVIEGQPVELSGPLVSAMIGPCIRCSVKLFNAIDGREHSVANRKAIPKP